MSLHGKTWVHDQHVTKQVTQGKMWAIFSLRDYMCEAGRDTKRDCNYSTSELCLCDVIVSFDVDVFNRIKQMQREMMSLGRFYYAWLQLVSFRAEQVGFSQRLAPLHDPSLLSVVWMNTFLYSNILIHDKQGRINDLNCLVKRYHSPFFWANKTRFSEAKFSYIYFWTFFFKTPSFLLSR